MGGGGDDSRVGVRIFAELYKDGLIFWPFYSNQGYNYVRVTHVHTLIGE